MKISPLATINDRRAVLHAVPENIREELIDKNNFKEPDVHSTLAPKICEIACFFKTDRFLEVSHSYIARACMV